MSNNQPWPIEQEEELRRLFFYKQDDMFLSYTYIAMLMQSTYPHVRRGAIVSKLKRLKLERDPTVKYISANGVVIDPTVTDFSGKMKVSSPLGINNGKRTDPRAQDAGEFKGAFTATACQVTELGSHNCHFPIGHVGFEGFHFCGATVTRGPYCAEHTAVCMVPNKPRERRPVYR